MAVNAKKLLDLFLNSGMATGVVAGMLGGALARRTGLGGIAKVGGLALVGTLAYQAWQRHKENELRLAPNQRGAGDLQDVVGGVLSNLPGVGELFKSPPPASSGFASADGAPAQQNDLGVALLTAMISAAKADGEVDRAESQRIMGQMDQAGLSSDEKSFLLTELARPINIEDVAKHASSPEVAAQIYTASAIVIDTANQAEQHYLDALAKRMNLDQTFVAELNRQIKALS